jgi:hypothetical protein
MKLAGRRFGFRIRPAIWLLLALLVPGVVIAAYVGLPSKSITPVEISNRNWTENIKGADGATRLFYIRVPAGASHLQFIASGEAGKSKVDLYAKFNERPSVSSYDGKSIGPENEKIISIPAPKTGTYYIMVHGAHGRYSDISLVASYVSSKSPFKVGMHAHRLFNGGDWEGPESKDPSFQYGLIRDWDISHLHDAVVWKSDGSINFPLIEKVYSEHARFGAKVVKTFGTVPTWASKRPQEPNKPYPDWPGGKSGPRDLDEYEDYVFRFVSRLRPYLWAVEGWNEPYACPEDKLTEFTTMTPTELADTQKRLYLATKRVDPKIIVFSPAQAYVCGIPTILNARTSENEPMWKFFDALAWHPYNRSARGNAGPSFAMEVKEVRKHLSNAGLPHMPIANTEHGWLEPPKEGAKEFYAMSDEKKAQVLYETTQMARSLGLLAVVWYGYDNNMIGKPMQSPVLSRRMQQIYKDFNTP